MIDNPFDQSVVDGPRFLTVAFSFLARFLARRDAHDFGSA
jgi:hypothetical protein